MISGGFSEIEIAAAVALPAFPSVLEYQIGESFPRGRL